MKNGPNPFWKGALHIHVRFLFKLCPNCFVTYTCTIFVYVFIWNPVDFGNGRHDVIDKLCPNYLVTNTCTIFVYVFIWNPVDFGNGPAYEEFHCNSILVNLRYLRFKLLKYKDNNKKIRNTFDHNFKYIPLYIMRKVSLETFYCVL